MAGIELVIKIPEKEFGIDINGKFQEFFSRLKAEIKERLITNTSFTCGAYELETIDMFLEAFKNAITLPKGHGELKDFNKIEWYGCDLEGRGCIQAKGDCSVCNHANCYAKQVRELPTVIEADKESEE